MWVVWKTSNRRAYEEIETDFVHMRNNLLPLLAFWCTLEISICIDDWVSSAENHVFDVNSLLFGISLVYGKLSPILIKLSTLTKKKKGNQIRINNLIEGQTQNTCSLR